MLESLLKSVLQKLLGYDNYLFLFAKFCIKRMDIGNYESSFVHFMKMIPDDGAIVDVGANIGVMSASLLKRFPESKIYAFEPIPSNINAFKRVMKTYKANNVTLYEVAVGDRSGEIKMVLPIIKNSKHQGLSHIWQEGNTEEWNKGVLYNVPIVRLDDLAALQNEKNIVAIKIDVENYEFEVLKGATELIKKFKPIVYVELWKNDIRLNCISFFKELGYVVKVVEKNEVKDYTDQDDINFFFLPKSA